MNKHPNVLIRASAGTGKTFQLSNRFLILLHSGVAPDEILATTFTRKAAGEIVDRVMIRLAQAATKDGGCETLAGELAIDSLTRDECHAMLRLLVNHLHRLRICTLDAFFAQLASSFSLELGLPSGWHIIEPLHDQYLRTAAIEATLRGDSLRDVSRLISLMTKGDAQRSVRDLVDGTVRDLYTLFLESDREAWHQVPRPRKLGSEPLADVINALGQVELPVHKSIKTAHEKSMEAAQAGDWETFIGGGLSLKVIAGETVYYRKEISEETLEVYSQIIGHARAVLLEELAQQTEATHELLDKFHGKYGQLKHQARGLRFEDVTRSLARQRTLHSIDQQHFRLDAPLSHLLLDEFQDTSLGQWQVLQPFAEHVVAQADVKASDRQRAGRSFFCVGDAKQAIYGWRGGRSEIFEAIEDQFEGLHHETLSKSYRSAQPVIDTVNQIFTRVTDHPNLHRFEPAVERWCGGFPKHETARDELRGYAELRTAPLAGEERGQADVTIDFAAECIQQLVERSPKTSVGVLVRKNATVAQMIYELRARGVSASEEGGNPLTDSVAVQLILSLFRLADHPGNTVARFHLAESPLAQVCKLTGHKDVQGSYKLARQFRRELMDRGYGATVYRWVRLLLPSCSRRDRSRLTQLVELAYRYQQLASLRPADFLRYVEGLRVADPTTAEVRVMTIHQAKGLQFDAVVLAELDVPLVGQPKTCVVGQPSPTEPIDRVCRYRNAVVQKLLPNKLRELFDGTTDQAVIEALCVLYVALTRPVHALQMIIAPSNETEKTLLKTPAGLLRAALTTGERIDAETIAFQTGDPDWYQQQQPAIEPGEDPLKGKEPFGNNLPRFFEPPEVPLGNGGHDAVTYFRTVPYLASPVPTDVRLAPTITGSRPRHQAPSRLEGGARVSAARVLDLGSSVAMQRGTLVHAWFEQVDWLDQTRPEESILRRIAQQHDTAGLDVDRLMVDFYRSLETPEIGTALSQSFYESPRHSSIADVVPEPLADQSLRLELHRERQFVVRNNERLLSGAIDRLVLLYDQRRLVAADILDFKTDGIDKTDSARVEERGTFYRPQIEAYRSAVSTMFHLPSRQISARLLFVFGGVAVEVRGER